ncbi:MAG: hypothetical protein IT279_14725 [Ignavibacteriaceae bacterium]|nr:hypothetical protein [Ignavibacteriaceae bacterium]
MLQSLKPVEEMFAATGLKIIGSQPQKADKLFDEFFNSGTLDLEDLELYELLGNEEEMKKYLPRIFTITFEEGLSYIELNFNYLLEIWGKYLSEEYRTYIILETEELMYDAAFTIPPDEVAAKVVARELYTVKYPETIYAEQMEQSYKTLLYFYLGGIDNSPVFDNETGILTDEAKLSFENTIRNYPDTETAAVTKRYYEAVLKNNFKRSKLSDQIIEPYAPQYGEW